ncbi:cytochrome d ubiquinol oxidase subunit II [Rhodoluna sp. KAS3]|uniref:cytochrome d ubiquinol oxidase subunit II n=1 Tax=Rhodoluna sp. KAS3 TaxID=942880 RepID=UPI00222F7CB8|nr:cytochrome d ubiquinol oxidase subunit II [Rhodoluna sp. KAS3]BDS49166.1 cytochrome c oxidase assembly protein [Rhodoluna sp. KAS3]
MQLNEIWFLIVGFLFIGYFVLDGFDFGVGMSLPFLGKDDTDRRVLINTIGPVWDLNETWVIVAGASLFAAFPEWYASLFSGFYLPLLIILVALIMRGVAFEYRGKGHTIGANEERWKANFDWMIVIGSAVPALLWGVAFANIVQGVPLNQDHVYTGTIFTLLNPYGLLGGLVTLTLFWTHGLVFITLKTDGDIKERARALATKVGSAATLLAATFLVWTLVAHFSVLGFILSALAAVSLIAGLVANLFKREGISFTLLVVTIITAVGSLFAALFPNVFPSSIDPAFSLTIENASSSQYTLTVMTWVAVFMIPLVLAYQTWTYWVFRKRVSRKSIPAHAH